MRTAISVSLAAALILGLGPRPTGAQQDQQAVTVDIQDFSFQPHEWTITVGTPVRWVNHDDTTHQGVTEDGKTANSGPISPGKEFTFVFTQAGRFTYRCAIHPTMLGVISAQ